MVEKDYLRLGTVILLSLQSSNALAVLEINPDLLLIFVVLHSLQFGEFKGVVFGFSIGLLEDAMAGTLFGLNSFILTLISWLTNIYKKYIFVSDIVAFLIYIVIATIIKYILTIFFSWIFKQGNMLSWFIILKMAGEIAYNAIIGTVLFLVYPVLVKKDDSLF